MIAVRKNSGPVTFLAICEICGARPDVRADTVGAPFGYEDVESAPLQAHLVCSCELTLTSVE